jgi:NADH-quinone oxidoreductase subunit C
MMDNDILKARIIEILPSALPEEGGEWPAFMIEPSDWLPLATHLRLEETLCFDYLFCLTCVDWKTHLTMVYHLSSTRHRHNVVVKSKLDRVKPEIETVSMIWRTAEFHEREVYEMFGVHFLHHPDLRLLILPDGWEGRNPLLKDFDDPVNMIRL